MFRSENRFIIPDISDGYGVVFRDLDGDGRPDVYLVCFRSLNRVLINRGGGAFFEDATILSGLGGNLMSQRNQNLELGASVFDFDNDGDSDVMIGGWDITTRLYENTGDLTFREVRINAFPEADMDINGVAVADVDRDGWLDLFLTDEHYTNRLFIQRGTGDFRESTFSSGLESTGISQGAAFCDVDLDGDPDLYVANWFASDLFYENLGNGRFRKKTLPISTCRDTITTNSASFCDIDRDGDFDLFVTSREGPSFLYRNDTAPGDSNWVFVDVSIEWGLADSLPCYSGVFGDFNNDGWTDLFVTKIGPNQLYLNDGGVRFVRAYRDDAVSHNRFRAYSTGAACSDYDDDGDLDLFVANKDTFAQFYVNPLNDNRFIRLKIEGVRSNRDAIGARVAIYPTGLTRNPYSLVGCQEVGMGNGYLSMNDLTVHFGLDTLRRVDVVVTYPSGRIVIVRNLENGRDYSIYEYPRLQRTLIRGVRHACRLVRSPAFLKEAFLFLLYLLAVGIFLLLGLKRYAWQTGTLSVYLAGYSLLALSGLTLLDPLGRITAWLTVLVLMTVSLLIFIFYSERNYRYKQKRKHYREVLIRLGEKVIQIHDDPVLLKTVVDTLYTTTEFSRCSAWMLNARRDLIGEGLTSGFDLSPDDLNALGLISQLTDRLNNLRILTIRESGNLAPLFERFQAQILFSIVREETVYGFFTLGSDHPVLLAEEDAALFKTLANQMAVALDNNAYIRESNELVQQLTESKVREKYLKELEAANVRLDTQNRELQKLYDELKTTEMQLIHSEKMASLGQLVAGISHELNNPVGFIYANVKQLKRYIGRIEKALSASDPRTEIVSILKDLEGLIQDTIHGSQMVKTLVENLRHFSHLDQAEWKEADIHDGLASSLLILRPRLKGRIDVKNDYRATRRIYCNPGQINQVFVNILANATQAISGEGVIRITTEDYKDGVIIQISDNGRGIPDDILPKIFDPFFTTKPVGEGTGLGLSISYSIIQKHGGRIEVTSQIGKGSTFQIFLPINRNDGGNIGH